MTGGLSETRAALASLLEAIFVQYHHDFRNYAPASLERRVVKALAPLGCDTIGRLEERIRHDPGAFPVLLRFLTVQVSDLFRDPSYYRSLREMVVPYLRTYPSLKVWVAGCATGEEAYSMAILLAEEGLLDRTLIYATDISAESLRIAQAGVYDIERFAGWSASYLAAGGRGSLSSYYTARYGRAMFDRALRSAILFCDHSLATDGAFSECELVSCRNVLIYFDRPLQDRAVGVIRESLCRRGFLALGLKESLRFTAHATAFEELVASDKIYRRCT